MYSFETRYFDNGKIITFFCSPEKFWICHIGGFDLPTTIYIYMYSVLLNVMRYRFNINISLMSHVSVRRLVLLAVYDLVVVRVVTTHTHIVAVTIVQMSVFRHLDLRTFIAEKACSFSKWIQNRLLPCSLQHAAEETECLKLVPSTRWSCHLQCSVAWVPYSEDQRSGVQLILLQFTLHCKIRNIG